MKQKLHRAHGGKLKGLFCLGLTAVLAAGIALNSAAADAEPVQYDVKVVSTATHTASLSKGDLYLWGNNSQDQFPDSDVRYSPEPLKLMSGVADVAVSVNRTLVVSQNGELRSFGIEPSSGTSAPEGGLLLAKDADQVASSNTFAAYVSKDGALYAWGNNDFYQLGRTGSSSDTPVCVFESGVQKVSVGDYFAMALMDDGTVYGWGLNSSLETGYMEDDSPVEYLKTPTKITDNAVDISTGCSHSCILKKNGTLYTCGDNTYGQTGAGGEYLFTPLTSVLSGIRSVSAGSYHNFAVSNDGVVYAWGYGQSGQLGDGTVERSNTPRTTTFDYVQTFACNDNTFGVTEDGSIYSFGNNISYQLGKTNSSDSLSPLRVLDKNMNWVYEDSLKNEGQGGESGNGTAGTDPDTNETPSEPEIVSTPFVSGRGDGTFCPDDKVTKAEFLRMLVSALCKDFDSSKNYGTPSFSDVPLDAWYGKYVAYAEQYAKQGKKLVNGRGDGTFGPTDPITRAEASLLTAAFLELDTSVAPDAGFTDLSGHRWAEDAINALVADKTLSGDGTQNFHPGRNMTRAEAVTLISRALQFRPTEAEKAEIMESFSDNRPFEDVYASKYYFVYLIRAVGYVE